MIHMGVHPEWKRVGDASAYGGVFKSDKHPGKVIKVQKGEYETWRNEADKQFRTMELNDGVFEVPRIGDSGFVPDRPDAPMRKDPKTGIESRYPTDVGISFISMDEADFAQVAGAQSKQKHAKARGLTDLYMKGILHSDDHNGNIKYNPKTDKPVLLDFGLARKVDGLAGGGKRTEWIQNALKYSDNTDMLDLWDEQHGELYGEHIQNPTKESAAALEDWRKQGQEVAVMTHPDIAPVNWSDDAVDTPASSRDGKATVVQSGARQWEAGKGDKRFPTMSPPRMPGTSFFEAHERAMARLGDTLGDLRPKAFEATPLRGALSVGAADLIPSRETVQTAYKKGPVAALKQHGKEFALSLPVAGAVASTSAAVPIVATAAAYAGPGLVGAAAVEALDEVVEQQTGEGIVPKFRQAIGTQERTGRVEGSPMEKHKARMAQIEKPPQIKPQTRKPRKQVKDLPMPEFGRRLRLAGERFNPSKGEFGLSELIFGR